MTAEHKLMLLGVFLLGLTAVSLARTRYEPYNPRCPRIACPFQSRYGSLLHRRCPITECRRNSDCGRGYSCCPGCGGCNECVRTGPIQTIDSCRFRRCSPGYRCVDEPKACLLPPCPQTRCVRDFPRPLPFDKPGVCPPASPRAGICVFRPGVNCLSDSQCSGRQKCCTEGCGNVCKNPLGLW